MIKITAIRFKTLQVSLISLGEYIYIYNTTRKYEETKIFLKKKILHTKGATRLSFNK